MIAVVHGSILSAAASGSTSARTVLAAATAALPDDHPEGMIARYVGVSDAGLAITVVWTSKAHADRFETEQLMPTVRRLMGPPSPDSGSTFYNFEATDVAFGLEEVSS